MSTVSTAHRATKERVLTGEILFLLAGLAALGTLATNIILPAFPQIGADLEVSTQDLALTLSSFFIMFAFGQLFVGPLSDRFGRQWLVLGGLAVFIGGSIFCAFATTLPLLILGRVIQALGACAASVLSRAIARDLFDGEELARALALTMIAMSIAPGFSPLVGSAIHGFFGWRTTFFFVAIFALVLALHYWTSIRETNPTEQRTSMTVFTVMSAYGHLSIDARFIFPALAVSFVLGGLLTFFAMAPAILMTGLSFTALQLGFFFAATVFIVIAAGFFAPRLARRWGQRTIGMVGVFIALAGSLLLFTFVATPTLPSFTIALGLYLFGMGLVNPLGTAIALQPYGNQAGLASALLGFLQMSCAAAGSAIASILPLTPSASLAVILSMGSTLALLVFIPVARRQRSATAAA